MAEHWAAFNGTSGYVTWESPMSVTVINPDGSRTVIMGERMFREGALREVLKQHRERGGLYEGECDCGWNCGSALCAGPIALEHAAWVEHVMDAVRGAL